jgi:hypothetical protein
VTQGTGCPAFNRACWTSDGNLYRLRFFTFAQGFNKAPMGNAYLGSYTFLTPLSRRPELIIKRLSGKRQ